MEAFNGNSSANFVGNKYNLTKNSPAKNKGATAEEVLNITKKEISTPIKIPTVDVLGKSRRGAPDVGAYEYVGQ